MASAPLRPLTDLMRARKSPEALLAGLLSKGNTESKDAGIALIRDAEQYGLGIREYLNAAVDPKLTADPTQRSRFEGYGGCEAAFAYLNLPTRNDLKNGIVLQAAAETFQTYPGTRAMFPVVMDDIVRWAYRQDQLENVAALTLGSRTINGTELVSTVVDDTEATAQILVEIEEGSRVPVKSIRTHESSVKIFKHGMGWRTTYEFQRRAQLDILTPYVNRAVREEERSKVLRATNIIINGDGVQAAAPVVTQSSFNITGMSAATNGIINWPNFLAWLVSRAKAGVPVDTVIGNYDSYLMWLLFFSTPTANLGQSGAEIASKSGMGLNVPKLFTTPVSFALSSTAPAGKLIGITKNETVEELVEAGSLIQESERSVLNQTITYVRTSNSGFRLPFGDTRSIYNYAA